MPARLLWPIAVVVILIAQVWPAPGAAQTACKLERLTYRNGDLDLVAWLVTPNSGGPFPVLVMNHGFRAENIAARPSITPDIACNALVVRQGFALFYPERRGYGGSAGLPYDTYTRTAGPDAWIPRLVDEATDVVAGVAVLFGRGGPIDQKRVVVVGQSYGGLSSLIAVAQKPEYFRGHVSWAGGTRLPQQNPNYQRFVDAMIDSGMKYPGPLLFQHEIHDRSVTVDYARLFYSPLKERRASVTVKEYAVPIAQLGLGLENQPDGHSLFYYNNIDRYFTVWGQDLLTFVREATK